MKAALKGKGGYQRWMSCHLLGFTPSTFLDLKHVKMENWGLDMRKIVGEVR